MNFEHKHRLYNCMKCVDKGFLIDIIEGDSSHVMVSYCDCKEGLKAKELNSIHEKTGQIGKVKASRFLV